jgi:CRP/FNR family transcriptional regulator
MSRSFYPAGTTIFEQAESPHGVYCVSSGIVELFKTDRSGIKTESMSLGPGDTFGYETLHSAEGFEAKVIEDARICFYPKYPFYRLLQNSKLFFKNLTRIAIHRGLHERGAIIYDD